MWEKNLLSIIPDSQIMSRQELYQLFKTVNSSISYNSLGWIIEFGLKSKLLFKVGSDSYSKDEDSRKIYSPKYTDLANKIDSELNEHFPELKYTIFETLLLNEFVNHLYSKNIIVIQIEKDLCPFTFDFFTERFPNRVLFNPSVKEIEKYTSDSCIIIEPLISESPLNKEKSSHIKIEKLLVDCSTDKIFKSLIPNNELVNIFSNVSLVYKIDLVVLRRYARRRNAWDRVESLLNGENR